ncbi:hypothetical protein ACGFX4_41205 [Kitasatospora sp. NPDC048365]|uniref:hypothetical protein n=1 Tax=Kitasatospora sp. NPDC048365 TaxID=3364050 RepID=UPI003723091F
MTATNNAPDQPDQPTDDRWQHILDRITALERRIHELNATTITALDTHLARLEALRHDLAHHPWPPDPATHPAPRRTPLNPGREPELTSA